MHEELIEDKTVDGFTIKTYACQEDTQIRGNAVVSGDAAYNKKVENRLIKRLDNGDLSAWFCARVECSKEDVILATDYLGGCSYRNFKEFLKPGDYHSDMVATVISEAKTKITNLSK